MPGTMKGQLVNGRPGAHADAIDFAALQSALAGQFSLERELGRGGMGVVYLAREVQLDRPVAIKVLPPALAAQSAVRERFLREARTAARLSHPNIVPVYRAGEAGGFVFFVMAYVDGQTLGNHVRRRGALSPHEVAKVVRDVGWALAYAHARGVVHRDVKPENILLERETGRVLVTDFGIAALIDRGGALMNQGAHPPDQGAHPHGGAPAAEHGAGPVTTVLGTAHFMSPEQASGRRVDGRSDLYSLGVVAWYALTGRPPFDGPTEAVLAKHRSEAPPSLLAANPAVPPALAEAVRRAMAKSPDDRYPDAEAFAEAVALSVARHARLSAPLHAWLAGGDDARPVVAVAMGLLAIAVAHGGLWEELAAFVAAAVVAAGVSDLVVVRGLFAAGYRLGDLRRAIDEVRTRERGARGARARANLHAEGAPPPVGPRTFGSTFVRVLGASATVLALAAAAVDVRSDGHLSPGSAEMAALALAGGLLLGAPRRRPFGILPAIRARVWRSRAGDALARLMSWHWAAARERAAPPWAAEAMLGRATQSLFAALPARARDELRDFPGMIQQLEDEAGTLRGRIDQLSGVLATLEADQDADPGAPAQVAERRRAAITEARAERDAAGRQLATAVSALETIRLDLLDRHANPGGASGPTEPRGAPDAHDVSAAPGSAAPRRAPS